MGEWAGTCGLTHLPIKEGDEIRVVMITQVPWAFTQEAEAEPWASGYTYTTSKFYPRTVALRGIYNNVGGVTELKDISPLHEAVILEGLKKDVVGEIPWESTSLVDFINEYLERDEVRVRDQSEGRHEPSQAGVWLCHEGAYQSAIRSVEIETYRDGKSRKVGLVDIRGMAEPLLTRAKEMGESNLKLKASVDEADPEAVAMVGKMINGALWHAETTTDDDLMQLYPNCPFGRGVEYYSSYMMGQYSQGIEVDDGEARALLRETADMAALNFAMDSGRIGWMPLPGKGSSNESMTTQKALARFAMRRATEFSRRGKKKAKKKPPTGRKRGRPRKEKPIDKSYTLE